MANPRFVVDEESLKFEGVSDSDLNESLETFAQELIDLRDADQEYEILSGWGSIAYRDGEILAELLRDACSIDRDLGVMLLGLLGKCVEWDEPVGVVINSSVSVNGNSFESFGIAWAVNCQLGGLAKAVVTLKHRPYRFEQTVFATGLTAIICFVVSSNDHLPFFRSIFKVENIGESEFLNCAKLAFPALTFADTVSFRRFEGAYADLRECVVYHLSALNDSFMHHYRSEGGDAGKISTHIGIDVSREGNKTRGSETLMKLRDAVLNGVKYRCEWHSKIEPNRNRIHFFPPPSGVDNPIVVGIFVDHLTT